MDIVKFVLSRLDNTTAWVGIIGFTLLLLHMTSALMLLFVALFFVPETNLTDIFKKATSGLRNIEKEYK